MDYDQTSIVDSEHGINLSIVRYEHLISLRRAFYRELEVNQFAVTTESPIRTLLTTDDDREPLSGFWSKYLIFF